MGEKQVWEIIKNFNCADLKIVVDPAVVVWNHQQSKINEHTEVIKLQDADLRKYEKQIESLKEQLNNMERCYIEKKKQVEAVSQVLCELKESMIDFQEMDLYDKGHRVTTEYVITDLEEALRGAND